MATDTKKLVTAEHVDEDGNSQPGIPELTEQTKKARSESRDWASKEDGTVLDATGTDTGELSAKQHAQSARAHREQADASANAVQQRILLGANDEKPGHYDAAGNPVLTFNEDASINNAWLEDLAGRLGAVETSAKATRLLFLAPEDKPGGIIDAAGRYLLRFGEEGAPLFSPVGRIADGAPIAAENAIRNQWVGPEAVYREGRRRLTVWASVGNLGEIRVHHFDHDAQVLRSSQVGTTGEDDHNAPAIVPPRPGTGEGWRLFWAGHGVDQTTFYAESAGLDDLSTWGAVQSTTWPDFVTYSQVIDRGAERWLFARQRPGWSFKTSTDGGTSWSAATKWVTGDEDLYALHRLSGDGRTMHVAFHCHPDTSTDQDLYRIAVDMATGEITSPASGAVLGSLRDDTTLPVQYTDAEQVYAAAGGERTRLWDISPWGDVIYSVWTEAAAMTDGHYYAVSAGGTQADLGPHGRTVDYDAGNHPRGYFGGAQFSRAERGVIFASKEAAGNWRIERLQTPDAFASFVAARISPEEAVKRFRPVAVRNGLPELQVLYCRGAYRDYYNADGDAQGIADFDTQMVGRENVS